MPDEMKDIKKLSPEERLKRLKELEEKSKKEIAEAQKMIKQSEGEIEEKKKFEEKVPIPQLIAEEERTLESQEAVEMFEAQREISGRPGEKAAAKPGKSLEEQLKSEHIEKLAMKPALQLKDMMADIYKRAEAHGGQMTQEERGEVYSINKAEQDKIYAMQDGQYPEDQMAGALENISATFAMGKHLRQMYEAKGDDTGGGDYQR
ncbi:MAG: hypothetical protein KAT77_00525 [Nanoarchaeota archaeon]|nr:hypothetical protein [Nanoarchaeota archaeon]